MRKTRVLLAVAVALSWGVGDARAQNNNGNGNGNDKPKTSKRIPHAARKAAAEEARAKRNALIAQGLAPAAITVPQRGVPDYFSIDYANWAFSPPLTKFIDTLPKLNAPGANNLGQYIPVAIPDTTTYPGSDYYEIEFGQYTEKMHTELPATTLRGYRQTNTSDPTVNRFHYLGPMIVAQKNRPVRIKFTNSLPTGTAGKLFVPVDTTVHGAGPGPNAWLNGPTPSVPADALCPADEPLQPAPPVCYADNRGTPHLHGGRTPWISDGTPFQYISPAGEATDYPTGPSVSNVPDMPDPGAGSETLYWTNQQSARLMFYHDHAFGVTRLNVYAGAVGGYSITDAKEQELLTLGLIPPAADTIPLVVQDKTFVDATTVLATDPTWNFGTGQLNRTTGTRTPNTGDLWWPHVYVPGQHPTSLSGVNPTGRWAYGPWFWPPTNNIMFPPVPNPYCLPTPGLDCTLTPWEGAFMPGTPNVSWVAEAFLDTPVINGTAFPKLTVDPKPYRFRILNGSHDRFWNLQLYQATGIVGGITLTGGGSGYTTDPAVTITNGAGDTTGHGAAAAATIDAITGAVTRILLTSVGSGYTADPVITIAPPLAGTAATATATVYTAPTEVGMVPAAPTTGFPALWPQDGREGGAPDPTLRGPDFIQIASEGGFLPAPAIVPAQPIIWNGDPLTFNFGNISNHALLLAPAERADVIVDFSAFAGKTLILYNDAPAAFPALDPRMDYYTGHPDFSMNPTGLGTGDGTGGTTPTLPGKGPNTRTLMQITVNAGAGAPFNLVALQAGFVPPAAPGAAPRGVFATGQEPIIVGQTAYNAAYNKTFPATWPNWGLSRIQDNSLSFETTAGTRLTVPMHPKAAHDEMGAVYDDYGRMSAKLGLEVPFTGNLNQTFLLQGFGDPPTETVDVSPVGPPIAGDGTQIWKITHNGVDTHPIHFHIFDVQLINRVGWDGAIRLPDENELGWKDTIRVSPLEDTIVALRPVAPTLPFSVPASIRPLDPTLPIGATYGFNNLDQFGNPLPTPVVNALTNFGWEYVWHCHILSHEEQDMMRPIVIRPPDDARAAMITPAAGSTLTRSAVTFNWSAGTGVTQYGLWISTTHGAFDVLATYTNATTYTASVPTTGAPLFVRLWSQIGGQWTYYDYAYTQANLSTAKAAMVSPAPGSTLTAASVTFNWTTGTGVTQYAIWIGTTAGGFDVYANYVIATQHTVTVPATGAALYVRLWSLIGGVWEFNDYTYTQADLLAAMATPTPGSTLTGAAVTFVWSTGSGVSQYALWVGTTAGGFDVYAGFLAGTSQAVTVPGTGAALYVRLWSMVAGAWQSRDYTYTQATLVPAVMITPAPGSTIAGTSATFNWTAGTGVTQYALWIGTTAGGFDVYAGYVVGTSYGATLPPATGGFLYVRLWSLAGGVWQFNDYTYVH